MANQIVQLKDSGNNLFPNPNIAGINVNDLLATGQNLTFVAEKDCVALSYAQSNYGVEIDNVYIMDEANYSSGTGCFSFYIKKGQNVHLRTSNYAYSAKVFGLKYI